MNGNEIVLVTSPKDVDSSRTEPQWRAALPPGDIIRLTMMNRISYFVLGSLAGVALSTAVLQGAQKRVSEAVRDAVKVTPQYYTVRLDNDRVRVLDYRLPAGQAEALHTHEPGVAYVISGAKLRTATADGVASEGTLTAGDVHWRDKKITHAVQNVGDTELRALIVELKDKK